MERKQRFKGKKEKQDMNHGGNGKRGGKVNDVDGIPGVVLALPAFRFG